MKNLLIIGLFLLAPFFVFANKYNNQNINSKVCTINAKTSSGKDVFITIREKDFKYIHPGSVLIYDGKSNTAPKKPCGTEAFNLPGGVGLQ